MDLIFEKRYLPLVLPSLKFLPNRYYDERSYGKYAVELQATLVMSAHTHVETEALRNDALEYYLPKRFPKNCLSTGTSTTISDANPKSTAAIEGHGVLGKDTRRGQYYSDFVESWNKIIKVKTVTSSAACIP